MLFVVCGADCDNVGDIYECPQGTYTIGRRAPLQNNFIYTKTPTTKIFCNTNNKLFMILYNCNFMMYCMRFHKGFLFGREGGWGSECTSPGPASSPCQWKTLLLLPYLRPLHNPSSQSLFTIGSVTAYTSGPSSTFW